MISKDTRAKAFAKIANLPKILEAARVLHEVGLLEKEPHEYVKQYVSDNPEINGFLGLLR